MLRTIHLHGSLGKQFGKSHRLSVSTAGEALRALNCNFPGKFVEALQTGSFKLVRGDKRNGMHFTDVKLVNSFNLGSADLHLIPVARGAGNGKGAVKTIIGTALIGGAIFLSGGTLAAPLANLSTAIPGGLGLTWGNIAAIGLGVTLAGVSTLLSRPTESTEQKQSYNINGASNVGNQGDPIQLIYGRTMVQTVNISFDANIEDIGAYQGIDYASGVRLLFPAGNY
ncbi:tail assembly protein [Bradyrhizobium sp. WSM 1704]|uniref:hypothetical protein n=1 Tax=Bradyrhizobium semiaridum TaxID=2821404 RepID=UPI001CE29C0C|nr:hypothetical protein [Bradyrhizobium semiaridum]MCA6124556.1 tail assembly protein [Bradyrhizobium semiaridum]